MANEETTAAETAAEAAPEEISEQTYSLAELKANAVQLFEVQPEVIDGALYNNPKQEFTVSEMKKLINTFMKRKVK